MLIGIAVVWIAGVLFLIIFNIRAMKRSQAKSGKKRPKRQPGAPVANRAQPASPAESGPRGQPSDAEYRQALRSFSGRDSVPEASKEKQEAPLDQSKDDAYREALRALSKREQTEGKDGSQP
jgi:Na+-transporting methylmalonyl-CoA/oxaloacetate decarboxylase gamma subunit